MQLGLNLVIFVAMAALVVVLGAGLWNTMKGGSGNTSQKLMRARVLVQFAVVVLLMLAVFLFAPRS